MDVSDKTAAIAGKKSSTPRRKPEPMGAAAREYRPFTRLEQKGHATTDEFEREGMGIAAKE